MSIDLNCFTIGLTGGIASGKSAVSRFFEELNCSVIDADIVAREVVEPGTDGLNLLKQTFGKNILTSSNTLDRLQLRKIVFNNAEKLSTLNSILHPLIQSSILAQVKNVKSHYCLIVIPLLCETSKYDWLDRILVVDVKTETQLERLLKRDNINQALANKMIESQCSREQRLKIADDVINNEQTLKELKKQVELLNRLYKNL
ncbi:MAG: dephospho-CoA kinase [Marinicellaceae bacterium]